MSSDNSRSKNDELTTLYASLTRYYDILESSRSINTAYHEKLVMLYEELECFYKQLNECNISIDTMYDKDNDIGKDLETNLEILNIATNTNIYYMQLLMLYIRECYDKANISYDKTKYIDDCHKHIIEYRLHRYDVSLYTAAISNRSRAILITNIDLCVADKSKIELSIARIDADIAKINADIATKLADIARIEANMVILEGDIKAIRENMGETDSEIRN